MRHVARRQRHWLACAALSSLLVLAAPAGAQFSSGSSGANGVFPPAEPPVGTTAMTLNLMDGVVTFNPAGTTVTLPNVPAGGFADGVFHFTSVDLPAGVSWRFLPHSGNPPIVILATGTANIAGTIDARGGNGSNNASGGSPGPGGYKGGNGGVAPASRGSYGLGPGGGTPGGPGTVGSGRGGGGGGYGTAGGGAGGPAYGAVHLRPLLGGAGGGGASPPSGGAPSTGGGGAGGGAVAIAADAIIVSGSILVGGGAGGTTVDGSGGGGSGGAIRLTANQISGGGTLSAPGGAGGAVFPGDGSAENGGAGGLGRVRIEAFNSSFTGSISGSVTQAAPGPVFVPATVALGVTTVGGFAVPASPGGSLGAIDVLIGSPGTKTVELEASGVAPGTTVRVIAKSETGATLVGPVISPGLAGTLESSTTSVDLNFPATGVYFIEAQAIL